MYANGSVTVRPLPEEVHGTAAERTLPLRRLDGGPVEQREVDEYLGKELLKVWESINFCILCRIAACRGLHALHITHLMTGAKCRLNSSTF